MTLLRLIKYKLCLAVSFTGAAGYVLFAGRIDYDFILAVLAIFLMAGGSSALNQYQERKYDTMMPRTMSRPLPSGLLSPIKALMISIALIISGFLLLLSISLLPAMLGLLTVVFYNLMYTKLKRITYFAVLPGSLVGSLPPLIGWTSAGGAVFDMTILFLAMLIFLWQVPHFWLLLVKYTSEYEEAGYPTLLKVMDQNQVRRLIFLWISLSSVFAMSYRFFGIALDRGFALSIYLGAILFIFVFYLLLFGKERQFRQAFILSNLFITFLFIIIAIGSLIN